MQWISQMQFAVTSRAKYYKKKLGSGVIHSADAFKILTISKICREKLRKEAKNDWIRKNLEVK